MRGIQHDSRSITPGDLFVARKGDRVDGLAFVDTAIRNGAVAILAQLDHMPESPAVPVLGVPDVRAAIGTVASALYRHPFQQLIAAGITGTNGKTTTSYLTRAAIDGAGGRAAVLGTLGAHFQGLKFPSAHTTPEADELIRTAYELLGHGATHLVMEVSSHALSQARADSVKYRVAAFTNLTQDPPGLPWHHGGVRPRQGAPVLRAESRGRGNQRRRSPRGHHRPQNRIPASFASPRTPIAPQTYGRQAWYVTMPEVLPPRWIPPAGQVQIDSTLVGAHNLANLLMALAIAVGLHLPAGAAAQGLCGHMVVPGRLERCDTPEDDLLVLVDYAHSPDALERALLAIRSLSSARIHCVFGCGGDRDRGKRPRMGEVAGRLADVVVVTNDNPRSEDPGEIAKAVVEGLQGHQANFRVELDRAKAIREVVAEAHPGEVVLIAGKGHEPYQITGAVTRHFDDREEAREALRLRRQGKAT